MMNFELGAVRVIFEAFSVDKLERENEYLTIFLHEIDFSFLGANKYNLSKHETVAYNRVVTSHYVTRPKLC